MRPHSGRGTTTNSGLRDYHQQFHTFIAVPPWNQVTPIEAGLPMQPFGTLSTGSQIFWGCTANLQAWSGVANVSRAGRKRESPDGYKRQSQMADLCTTFFGRH